MESAEQWFTDLMDEFKDDPEFIAECERLEKEEEEARRKSHVTSPT